jgi:hypothetical protein
MRRHRQTTCRLPYRVLRPRLEQLEDRVLPSTVNWINPAGGNWDTASNWQDAVTGANHVPGPTDDAVIGFDSIAVTHPNSVSDSVHSLTSQATLAVSNGTLLFAADSSTKGLSLTGGTVAVTDSANLEVQTLAQTGGTLTGPGTVTVDGLWTWTGGSMSGAGHTVNNGAATLGSSPFGTSLNAWTVDNAGTAALAGTAISFANLATWNNLAGATLVLGNGASLGNFFGNSGQVNNAGLVLKSGAFPGSAGIGVPMDNTGTVDVQVGTLNISAGLTNEGTIALEPGTVATATGTVTAGNSSGTMLLAPGSQLTLGGTFTILSGAQLGLAAGSQLGLNGTVIQQAGAQVTLGAGSVVNASGNYILADGAAVSGAGLVEVTGFSGNPMTVNGAATITNLYIPQGTLTLAAQGNLTVQTLAQTGGAITGPGTVTVDGLWTWTGGSMSGAGHTVNNGAATLGGSPFAATLDTRTVDNAGTATLAGTAISFANLATWNNLAGATLVLGNGASLGTSFGNSGQLNNHGTILDTGPTSQSTISFAVINSGTVSLQGVLNISGSYTQTADGTYVVNLGPGSPPTFGQLRVSGPAALDGTLTVNTLPGFFPIAGQSFQIMTFSSVTGDFATFTGLDLGGGLRLDPNHTNTSYTLTATAV